MFTIYPHNYRIILRNISIYNLNNTLNNINKLVRFVFLNISFFHRLEIISDDNIVCANISKVSSSILLNHE